MNLSQLEVFVAIVDTGSLTEASEEVNLTQSAVSHSLSRLEAELGVTLLERGRQGIVLTQIGEDVLQHARNILNQTEIIRQKAARERGLSVGKLRFGCVPHVAGGLLAGIIRDFQQKYPDIEVVLFEGNPQELVEWLNTQVIDIATVLTSEGYAATVPLAQSEIKVIVSRNHSLASDNDISLEKLARETLIGPRAEYGTFARLLNLQNISLPRLRYEVSTQTTILAMIKEDMGVSMMPAMLVDFKKEGLIGLSLQPPINIYVYLATHSKSPAAQAFLQSAYAWAKSHDFLSDNT